MPFAELLAAAPGVISRRLAGSQVLDAHALRSHAIVVRSGCLGVRVEDPMGRSHLEVAGSNCALGLWPSAEGSLELRAVRVFALVPSVIVQAPLGALLRGLAADRALTRAAVEATGRQYACSLQRATILRVHGPVQRLAAIIAHLLEHVAEHCVLGDRRFLPLTQETIAEVASLSRQTTNRTLQAFAGAHIVHIERSAVCVLDAHRLRAVAEGAHVPQRRQGRTHCRRVHPTAPLDCVGSA